MKILLVGDTHANIHWWEQVVVPAAAYLDVDAVVQLGDFGFWPGSQDFVDAAAATAVPVFFLDGNHEHHEHLTRTVTAARAAGGDGSVGGPYDPVPLGGNLHYLPRGGRLRFDGVTVAAFGGAHSIDRAWRTPGVDWFPAEAVTGDDLARLAAGGAADVLLCHDAPASAAVPLLADRELSDVWRRERPACDAHRSRLDDALDLVRPSLVVHGHYHVRWEGTIERWWGTCRVVGLAEDGSDPGHNLAVLDCQDGGARLVTLHPA